MLRPGLFISILGGWLSDCFPHHGVEANLSLWARALSPLGTCFIVDFLGNHC